MKRESEVFNFPHKDAAQAVLGWSWAKQCLCSSGRSSCTPHASRRVSNTLHQGLEASLTLPGEKKESLLPCSLIQSRVFPPLQPFTVLSTIRETSPGERAHKPFLLYRQFIFLGKSKLLAAPILSLVFPEMFKSILFACFPEAEFLFVVKVPLPSFLVTEKQGPC